MPENNMNRRQFGNAAAGAAAFVAASGQALPQSTPSKDGGYSGGCRLVPRRRCRKRPGHLSAARLRQYTVPRCLLLRPRHRGPPGSRPAASRPRQAGVRQPTIAAATSRPSIPSTTETPASSRRTPSPPTTKMDAVATVLPSAKKRGMRTILWAEDVWRTDIPNIEKLQAVDLHGRKTARLCFSNPYYRNFLSGLVEDYVRSATISTASCGARRIPALSTTR